MRAVSNQKSPGSTCESGLSDVSKKNKAVIIFSSDQMSVPVLRASLR